MAKKKEEVFARECKTVRYRYEIKGASPILFHNDDISYVETLEKWRKDPQNKQQSVAGDDRSPAWTWIGYLYSYNGRVCMSSDNLMTMLRDAGAKIPVKKGRGSYKAKCSYGLQIIGTEQQFFNHDEEIKTDWINELIGETDFDKHVQAVKDHGFELFLKRAKIKSGKHIRVRPMFRDWSVTGEIEVIDETESGITPDILLRIMQIAGVQIGLCDWRPSCPSAGPYGKFNVTRFDIV